MTSQRPGGRSVSFRRTPPLAVALLAAVQASACSDDWTVGAEPVVRDSAGVTVVEHPEAAPRALDRTGEPDLVIGDQDVEPYRLARVGPLQPLASGNVVVPELASDELRFYDAGGAHLRTVEGALSGPAAFSVVSALWTRADTLFLADHRVQRLLRFDTAGTFLFGRSISRAFAADRPVAGAQCTQPSLAGIMADGTTVAWGWSCVDEQPGTGLLPATATLHFLRRDGRSTVGPFTMARVWAPSDSRDSWVVPPFAPHVSWAVGDDRVYVTRGEEYRIEVYDREGSLVRIVEEAGPPPEVRPEDREGFLEEAEVGYPEDVGFPARLPAYARLLVAENGDVWALRRSRPGQDRQIWTVFSSDGVVRRRIALPDLPWGAVGHSRVWGVLPIARNVQRVVAFDLN